jgi:hypothetical protein
MTDLAKAFEHLTTEAMKLNQQIYDLTRVQGTDMYVKPLVKQRDDINKQREQILRIMIKKEGEK